MGMAMKEVYDEK
ncbi:Putative uncharacterized protein [Lactococcus lactis subsp. lactis A12]|uniref:Uncharacterized protein n=1 Tax=Lactococcus lactis subsp. lactis A12 TaxID=1137134 RepID=S6FT89_LACLL|nr:Putative uncharacterized protein [Lactococcus lactis subsp. lactis A12]